MHKLWDSISKPPEFQDRKLEDYFDLDFVTLPHKLLVPEQFEAEVRQLRQRFADKSRPDYVFKPAYHKRIPADGVAFYMEGIWVSGTHERAVKAVPNILCLVVVGTSTNEQGPRSADSTRVVGPVPLR